MRADKARTEKVWALSDVQGWFVGRLPDGWFAEAPVVAADRDEILVVGTLAVPDVAAEEQLAVACQARISGFREDTREHRMRIADEAEVLWGRKVSWGAACGEVEQRFTTHAAPAMTRLRMDERAVLDTLIDAGVARTRQRGPGLVRPPGRSAPGGVDQPAPRGDGPGGAGPGRGPQRDLNRAADAVCGPGERSCSG